MMQLLHTLARRRHTFGLVEPTVAAGRWRYRRQAEIFRGPMTAVDAVRDFEIPGPAGQLQVRHYVPSPVGHSTQHPHQHPAPSTEHPAPLTVYFHGGGFVLGDLDTHDEPCRILCHHGGVHVLSIAYRCAPEHPFPAAVEDALAAYAWSRANAAALGADSGRVSVGGDSAGATLAAVVAQESRDAPPAAQLLIYPAADGVTARPSWSLFADGFTLTAEDRDAFGRYYAGASRLDAHDPRVSPLLARDLRGLAPTVLAVAGFDILRDEAEAYGCALAAAGVAVRSMRFPSLEHGFIHLTGISPAARDAMRAIATEWQQVAAEFPHNPHAER